MRKPNTVSILTLTLGWFGLQMALALDTTQFQVMLDQHIHNAFWIGVVLSLGPIAGITVQPLIGWYGDKLAQRGFSRALLIKIGVGLGLLSILGLSFNPGLGFLILCIGLFFMALNIVIVNYRALVTVISSRKALAAQKGAVSGFVALFSGAGSFAMFILCSQIHGTGYPFWIAALFLVVTFFLFFRYAPLAEVKTIPDQQQEPAKAENLFHRQNLLFYAFPLLNLWPAYEDKVAVNSNQKQIFRLFMVIFFSWIGIQALRSYFVLYALKSLNLSFSTANILLAVLTLVMLLVAVPLGKLADRFDNRNLLRYALLLFSVISFLAFFWVHSVATAVIMSIFLGISFAGLIVFPLSLLFKLCPAKSEGAYAGLYNLFLSTPQLFSLMLTGALIEWMNDYRIILPVAGISVFIAFLTCFRLQKTGADSQLA